MALRHPQDVTGCSSQPTEPQPGGAASSRLGRPGSRRDGRHRTWLGTDVADGRSQKMNPFSGENWEVYIGLRDFSSKKGEFTEFLIVFYF